MSKPELLSTQDLAPVRPTRSFLHNMACKSAEKAFAEEGGLEPFWLIASGTRVLMVGTPWEGTPEKRVSQNFVRLLLEVVGAQAYSFVSETWTAMVTKAELAFRAKMDWIDEHGVLALPPDQREEILMVTSAGRDKGDQHLSRYVINSGGKKPWLGIRTDEADMGGEGPLFNLFQLPVDERMMALATSFLMANKAAGKKA